MQRIKAHHRDIEWHFTFETWMKTWEDSGKLHLRGLGTGKYVMSRLGPDIGPYSPENVIIQTCGENSREGNLGKPISSRSRKSMSIRNTGTGNPKAKLTEQDVLTIRKLVSDGSTYQAAANAYGVDKTTIYDIVKRRSWKHIP